MVGSLERFQALIENSSDAISLVNPEGEVLYASASTAKVLGYQPEELVGQNGLDLLHPQDRDRFVRTLKRVLEEPQWLNRMQARVRQKDGRWRWLERTASNLLDDPRVGAIVVIYREIDKRRAEEERQLLIEELTRSNAELEELAHTIAHDLKEPLRTISAFTKILVRKAQFDEGDKEIADFITHGVRRMSTLLDDMISSATKSSNESWQPVELTHAAAQAMQNLREDLTSNAVNITVVQPLPAVRGNESNFIRVFQNLISNAVKYRSEAPVEIHITTERIGPDWVIRIRDNGIGIAREHHRRVFGLFTRLHPEQIPGAGIGLSACKRIVEGLGGTIWVESEPGAGSTFCFTVSADQEESKTDSHPFNNATYPSGRLH